MKTKTLFFRFFTILLLIIFLSKISFGQTTSNSDFFHKKRFNAGFIVGINSSELAGEGLDIFFGWNARVLGIAGLTIHLHLSLELLFSQNGEYLRTEFIPDLEYSKIRLNFVEIPKQIYFSVVIIQRYFNPLNLHL